MYKCRSTRSEILTFSAFLQVQSKIPFEMIAVSNETELLSSSRLLAADSTSHYVRWQHF